MNQDEPGNDGLSDKATQKPQLALLRLTVNQGLGEPAKAIILGCKPEICVPPESLHKWQGQGIQVSISQWMEEEGDALKPGSLLQIRLSLIYLSISISIYKIGTIKIA